MDRLTPRQIEIVALCCDGDLTGEEIAYRLGVSSQTVKNHKSNIIQRLQVRSFHAVCCLYGREQPFPTDIPARAMRSEYV